MKAIVAIVVLTLATQWVPLVSWIHGTAAADRPVLLAATTPQNPEMKGAGPKEDDRNTEFTTQYETRSKIIIVSIFGVLFVVCMYWYTYGKLHHRLPRY